MNKIFSQPSFYVHIVASFISLYSIYLFINNYSKIEIDKLIIILLLISISIKLHGLSHLGLEYVYKYNSLFFS